MPRLHRRIDGGFYIVGPAWGGGPLTTWQVNDTGVTFLAAQGIEDDGLVSYPLLQELRARGFAYTRGGGIQPQTPDDRESTSSGPPEQRVPPLPLQIVEEEGGWQLELLVPHLPRPLLEDRSARATILNNLGRCRLRVDDGHVLTAAHLWPSGGVERCRVAPHERNYPVQLLGPWPEDTAVEHWKRGADGLNPNGTLFAGPDRDNVRLVPGEMLVPGASYYLLGQEDALDRAAVQPIPRVLQPRHLGWNNGWTAWVIQLPNSVDDALGLWCGTLGCAVTSPPWRLQLVSPPADRFSANGLPVVDVASEALIAIRPPAGLSASARDLTLAVECDGATITTVTGIGQPRTAGQKAGRQGHGSTGQPARQVPSYVAIAVDRAGTYRLRVLAGHAFPLSFIAELRTPARKPPDLAAQPSPLQVQIGVDGRAYRLSGFADAGEEQLIMVPPTGSAPMILAACPTPVTASWSFGSQRSHRDRVDAKELSDLLEPLAAAALAAQERLQVVVDGGDFGRLRVSLVPGTEGRPCRGRLQPNVVAQLHWVSLVNTECRGSASYREIPFPADVRAVLARFRDDPLIVSLAQANTIAASLVPHLRALTYRLARSDGHAGRARGNEV